MNKSFAALCAAASLGLSSPVAAEIYDCTDPNMASDLYYLSKAIYVRLENGTFGRTENLTKKWDNLCSSSHDYVECKFGSDGSVQTRRPFGDSDQTEVMTFDPRTRKFQTTVDLIYPQGTEEISRTCVPASAEVRKKLLALWQDAD